MKLNYNKRCCKYEGTILGVGRMKRIIPTDSGRMLSEALGFSAATSYNGDISVFAQNPTSIYSNNTTNTLKVCLWPSWSPTRSGEAPRLLLLKWTRNIRSLTSIHQKPL
jgi:hypothetical protein